MPSEVYLQPKLNLAASLPNAANLPVAGRGVNGITGCSKCMVVESIKEFRTEFKASTLLKWPAFSERQVAIEHAIAVKTMFAGVPLCPKGRNLITAGVKPSVDSGV